MVDTRNILQSIYFLLLILMLISTLSVLFINNVKIQNRISCLNTILMVLIAGLRWETGTDWKPYYSLFEDINFNNIFTIKHHEFGYKIFNLLIKSIWDNYTFFLLSLSFIAVFLIYKCVLVCRTNSIVAMQFFYTNYFLAHYLGSNRRIIAIGLGLCMLVSISKSRYKQAVILFVFAMVFHRTSIILLLAFFIPRKKIGNLHVFISIILIAFIGLSNIIPQVLYCICLLGKNITNWYIFTNAVWHLNNISIESSSLLHNTFGIIKRLIYLIIFMLGYRKNKSMHSHQYFFNIYVISIALYCILINIGTYAIMSTYMCIVEIILWGDLIGNAKKNNKLFLISLIVILGIIQFINCFKGQYGYCFFPYKSAV